MEDAGGDQFKRFVISIDELSNEGERRSQD